MNQVFNVSKADRKKTVGFIARAMNRLEKTPFHGVLSLEIDDYEEIISDDPRHYMFSRSKFTVKREELKYNDTVFKAIVQETEDGETKAYGAPSVEYPINNPTRKCSECNKTRARGKVYVLEIDNVERIICSICVKNTMGLETADMWIFDWEGPAKFHESKIVRQLDPSKTGEEVYNAAQIVALSYVVIKNDEYTPVRYKNSTKRQIMRIMQGENLTDNEKETLKASQKLDRDQIGKTLQKELNSARANDWTAKGIQFFCDKNLSEVFLRDRDVGIAASHVSLVTQAEERNARNASYTNEWLAPPGTALVDIELTLKEERSARASYGWRDYTNYNMTFQTDSGHRIFWSTTSQNRPEVDQPICIDATVKSNDTFRGLKSTRIKNVKWWKSPYALMKK